MYDSTQWTITENCTLYALVHKTRSIDGDVIWYTRKE